MNTNTQTKSFQTEVKQLLDLVIHSLYSKKEVFLRELISNASDAIDRRRFEALTDDKNGVDVPYQIQIVPNKKDRTLTISDNGVGMTAEEVEKNIGTVASSGTKRFLQELKEKKNAPELIGQFGVGFYAAFMVADKVTMTTHQRGKQSVLWESDGNGEYVIGNDDDSAPYGTTIILHMKEGMDEYLDTWRIREIVKQYSDYIAYPIVLQKDPSAETEDKKDSEDGEAEVGQDDEEPSQINSMKAIWKRSKDDVSKDEYSGFYKHIAHDSEDPLSTIHFSAEGATEFRALLFIPQVAPYDMFFGNTKLGLQLYTKNVFIGDDIKELLPRYLSFIRGVVESSDLPLNVSREMLQDDAVVRKMRKVIVGKIIAAIDDLKKNRPDDFTKFNKEFGRLLKEGVYSDWENFDKLKELVSFPSTLSDNESVTVSLKDYVERMPSGQKDIYYVTADSFKMAKNSPLLESFAQHGFEVLFFVDPLDEFAAERLREYNGKKLCAIDRGEIDLDNSDVGNTEKTEKEKSDSSDDAKYKPLTDYLAERYKDTIKTARLSNRLVDSASCFVADQHGYSAHMERVMKSFRQDVPVSLRILELNPKHPIINKMLEMVGGDDTKLEDYADIIFGQAQLAEGTPLDNPARFNKLISKMM